jgi:hypothetical protein
VNGSEYHLKDFRVRVGTALVGTSTKVSNILLQLKFSVSREPL